ncbi:hypothetical protein KY290_029312 [Solanum tuberosum]|uniref:DUF4283 domain-containing protein n=1 Tax=Solanum tuberosum TaxID=4113 RepID=A0ABQ7UKE0_SOLTU|nr:hypothetical protein KY290_029312 [Solanum tuberosum]
MKLLKWTSDFVPEAETTLAPVWINQPDLRWHFFEWDALCRIVAPIGVPIISDKATLSKTRPTTAKIKVEIDITKAQIAEIQIVIKNENGELESIKQRVEYENIPEYCSYCKAQGHSDTNCRILHPELRGKNNGEEGENVNILKSQQKTKESLHESNEPPVQFNKGGTSANTKKDKDRRTKCHTEVDEGWTTVTKGKGKKQTSGENNQGGQIGLESNNQVDLPRNGKEDKVLDSIREQPKIFGITFKAQEINKTETARGKRKVSATPKMTYENPSLRKAIVQKKATETNNQKYERRTRSRKGNQEEESKDTNQQMDIHKANKNDGYKEEKVQTKDKDPLQTTNRIDKEVEESLDPIDRGKEKNTYLKEKNEPDTTSKMKDDYNHYESASEEEMEEDHFHDIQDHQMEKDPENLIGEAQGELPISNTNSSIYSNLVTVPIKLITKGTSLIDKDCYMVDVVNKEQMHKHSSTLNSSQ